MSFIPVDFSASDTPSIKLYHCNPFFLLLIAIANVFSKDTTFPDSSTFGYCFVTVLAENWRIALKQVWEAEGHHRVSGLSLRLSGHFPATPDDLHLVPSAPARN